MIHSMNFLDPILGRFNWYRSLRGGTWYGGGVGYINGKMIRIPWERLSGNVDAVSIALIMKRKYFDGKDEGKND